MLTAYPASTPTFPSAACGGGKGGGAHPPRKASWIDLLDPTKEEKASVESDYGLELPSREELSEVESSSRIAEENGCVRSTRWRQNSPRTTRAGRASMRLPRLSMKWWI